MTRTNIDIDDELIARVMEQNHLPTKKAAVDFALRKVVREPLTKEFLLSLEGIGWGSDGLELEDIRNDTHKFA